jgi:hypothetical protein
LHSVSTWTIALRRRTGRRLQNTDSSKEARGNPRLAHPCLHPWIQTNV